MILWRHRFSQEQTKFLSGFLPYDIVGRNHDNNFVGFWDKRCLHKTITVFSDLYYIFTIVDFKFNLHLCNISILSMQQRDATKKRLLFLPLFLLFLFWPKISAIQNMVKNHSEGVFRFTSFLLWDNSKTMLIINILWKIVVLSRYV